MDLRGKPDLAASVAEAAGSHELSAWLIELATPGSRFFSLGCDLGKYRKRGEAEGRPHATGGYVQLLVDNYREWESNDYKTVAEAVASRIETVAGEHHWDVSFLLQTVQFNLDGFNDELVSLSVEFNAWAADPVVAEQSRERLVRTIRHEFKQAGRPNP